MIENLLKTKHPLAFRNGRFKIAIFTDTQDRPDYDRRTVKTIEAVIETEKPDLVIFDGDNCEGCKTGTEMQALINAFVSPIEKHKIPWAHVYGNHDEETNDVPIAEQERIYESFEYCLSKTVPGIHGVSNYVLPVMSSDKKKIKFNVWGIDSNRYLEDLAPEIGYNGDLDFDARLPNPMVRDCGYGLIRFDQLMWYYNTSLALEQYNGERINGIACFHICLDEFSLVYKNPEETGMTGEKNEEICPCVVNSGAFATFLQRGDVKGIYCGHDHINTYEGEYCGIRLGFVPNVGFGTYGCGGDDENNNRVRGARIIEIDESCPDKYVSRNVFAKELGTNKL